MFFQNFKQISNLRKCSVVYIPPMEYSISKIRLSRIFNKPVVTDIYAPYYDMTVNDEKIYKKHSFMGRYYFRTDKYAIKKTTVALFLNEPEEKHFLNVLNIKNHKNIFKCLPLYIPERPKAKLNFFSDKSKYLNVCWTGSFINLQGVDKIIESAKILKNDNCQVKIHIIGPNSSKRDYWKKVVKDSNVEDIVDFPELWGDFDTWTDYIVNNCDVSLGIFGDSMKAKSVVANKVVEALSFRTPLITAKSSGISYFFKNNEINVVDNNPNAIADAIKTIIKKDRKTVLEQVDKGYELYNSVFSKQAFISNFKSIVNIAMNKEVLL